MGSYTPGYALAILLLLSCSSAAELRGLLFNKQRSGKQTPATISTNGTQRQRLYSYSHPRTRRERFPSVEERVKIYMSNWYSPPCLDSEKHLYTPLGENVQIFNMTIRPYIEPDTLFHLNKSIVFQCAKPQEERGNATSMSPLEQYIDSKPQSRGNMGMYCQDIVEMFEILEHLTPEPIPLLMQFGDMKHSHDFGFVNIPHFKKFRSATDDLATVVSDGCLSSPRPTLPSAHSSRMQPIIWKLATHRHFKHLPNVNKDDTPWALKKDMAIFRGQLTGALEYFDKSISAQENCDNMIRCHLVQKYANSTLVDAKLTTTRNRLPNTLGGVELVAPKVPIKYMMQHKALVMLEGNDVASGLKWALLSQSVVLMSKPQHTSWAMEELLEPWVHYIPLNDRATDVEEKMQWIIQHDAQAQRIAQRGSLWMEDLLYHPDAAQDERLVKEEMIRRYRAHFVRHATS